jgi:hypothetical protein
MLKLRRFVCFTILLSVVAFAGCEPPPDAGYDYYSLDSSGAVRSCRVYYPSSLENGNDTYPAVTLSGGFANSKSAMYWMAEYLAGEAGVIVFTISASNNLLVSGYEKAHLAGYEMMVAENGNPGSVLHQRIQNYGLMGYSQGGGGAIDAAKDLGGAVDAVISMATYRPESELQSVTAGCLMMVGADDNIAKASRHSEPAYENLPDSIDKCLLEFDSFSHLKWVSNDESNGNIPKKLAGDWIDYTMNGNSSKKSSFTNPPGTVVLNWNNL